MSYASVQWVHSYNGGCRSGFDANLRQRLVGSLSEAFSLTSGHLGASLLMSYVSMYLAFGSCGPEFVPCLAKAPFSFLS